MAKQSLPSVDDGPAVKQPQQQRAEPVVATNTPPVSEGYAGRGIDVKMNYGQAIRFKAILRMLEDRSETLGDGSPVNNRRRAVLWMIENFSL